MTERNERSTYLEPAEQMVLAAKVNRLCEISPVEFNEGNEDNLGDAREIIRLLDPRLEASANITAQIGGGLKKRDAAIRGATQIGAVDVSYKSEEESPGIKIGKVDEYKVGGFVAVKHRRAGLSNLRLEPFFGRGEVNKVLDKAEGATVIFYQDNLEIAEISRFYPIRRTFFKILHITTYLRDIIWQERRTYKH